MTYYLIQAKLTTEACKALLANPQDRTGAVANMCEAHSGKLHHYFFAMGESDIIVLAEAPDDKAAMAMAMTVGATGTVSDYKTTALVSAAEAVEIMQAAAAQAGAYQPLTS